jgi:hemerythrin-like domain-containing protein
METISRPMKNDHRHCDERFVETEEAQLFPAMETAASQAMAPIRIMRMEHDQMRYLIAKLKSAISGHEKETALGVSETLLVTMQQHNLKEEHVLYPMADRLVPPLAERIARDLAAEHA